MEVLDNKLQVKNLTIELNKKIILDNISFDVKDGEILSIIGPSGCGKTTLLTSLMGLYKVKSGNIIKDGEDITKYPASKRKIGIIFQDYSLFENMNVLDNVAYALKFSKDKKNREKRFELATEILDNLGLTNHLKKYPNQLSGGERQRVAIARTLILSNDIILFDEPMSALDVESKITFKNLILEIQKKFNNTMIYVTHDQEDALSIADRVLIMNKGKVEQIDTPSNIMKYPKNKFVKTFLVDNLLKRAKSINKLVNNKEKNNEKE